jgi:hypothetical protein
VEVPARLVPGASWQREMITDGASASRHVTTYRAVAVEDVDVPAGRFRAVKVTFDTAIPGATIAPVITGTQWHAQGIGLVRSTTLIRSETDGSGVEIESVTELTTAPRSSSYQTRHWFWRTIGLSAWQAKAFWNSGMLLTTPMTR